MSTDLCQTDSLLTADGKTPAQRISALDGCIKKAPALSERAQIIAIIDHPRKRRVALWEWLAEQPANVRSNSVAAIVRAANAENKAGLRLLFSFLCGKPTTHLYPERIASLRNCRRICSKLLLGSEPPDSEEQAWLADLQALLQTPLEHAALQQGLSNRGADIESLLSKSAAIPFPLPPGMSEIILLEARAASIRGIRLAAKVGDYDTRKLARALPQVIALDEWQGDLNGFALQGATALAHPLTQFLGEEEIERWRRSLGSREDPIAELISSWIKWMSATNMVGNEPAAWVALLRTLGERSFRKTLHAALALPERWRDGRLGLKRKPPPHLFSSRAIVSTEGLFWVDLSQLHWAEWVSPDGLPSCGDNTLSAESPLLLLRSRLQDDRFCELILGSEEWTQRPGVVELIARGCRSLKILLRIASARKLHSGSANRGVPLAMLENPSNIPISALRGFLNLRCISRHDLTRLSRGGPEIRREVTDIARSILKHM